MKNLRLMEAAIATLDPAAYQWARQSVPADGYLLDLPSYIEPTGLLASSSWDGLLM